MHQWHHSDITCISDIQGNRIREKVFAKRNNENNCHIHNGCSCFLPRPLMCWKNNMPRHPWLQQLGARVVSLHAAFTYHSRHFKKLVVTNLTMTILDGHTSDTPTKGKRHTHKGQAAHPQRVSDTPTKGKHRIDQNHEQFLVLWRTRLVPVLSWTRLVLVPSWTRLGHWLTLTHTDLYWLTMTRTDS